MKPAQLGRMELRVLAAVVLSSPGWAQVTQRVSVDSNGAQANERSYAPSISADGRYVAFYSLASDLVAGDSNGTWDVFVRDRWTGTTERVSVDSAGVEGDAGSDSPSISADGRYVAFASGATNLVPGDTDGVIDVFVRDRQLGITTRVSVSSAGGQGNGTSEGPSISADGRFVAFASSAANLVPGHIAVGMTDAFVHDLLTGTTERVSVDSSGSANNSASGSPSISSDGRYVAFVSSATNLVPGDTNGNWDVFVRDRLAGTTERVSVATGGAQGDGDSGAYHPPSISQDGRFVAFQSLANNLVPGDTFPGQDLFVRDRQNGTTEIVDVDSAGVQGNSGAFGCSISSDGRWVAFDSNATNLVPGDTNGVPDVFLRDRLNGTTVRVSIDSAGNQANNESGESSISADGRFVAFASLSTDLVAGDTNGSVDIFVHDLDATGFTSLCDPGVGGVIGCPCSNTPSGSGRGCDNSASTGGATLTASGIAYLSMDSLVFTTSGEKPTATSIVLQGTTSPPAGIVYGQGVRCVGGTLKRLFTKAAVGGSITAPDFGAGDPTVSARSAAKGDVIQPGQRRWYLVYYRDPTVLGGCPASSTFNATQTGRVDWSM
jgi:Tol biopolymer transport system component